MFSFENHSNSYEKKKKEKINQSIQTLRTKNIQNDSQIYPRSHYWYEVKLFTSY